MLILQTEAYEENNSSELSWKINKAWLGKGFK